MSHHPPPLTLEQNALVESETKTRIYLEGPAGCGKTRAAVERMLTLLGRGVSGSQILVLTPRRNLAEPFLEALNLSGVSPGGAVTCLTIGGLARRMLELFFPLVAAEAGFARPDEDAVFLTAETAQYIMARIVRPLLAEGSFETLVMERNRMLAQILDGLDKSALVGFPHTEIGKRLSDAWSSEKTALNAFRDAQECANRFRKFCLENNLLDFSLQMEVFRRHVWESPLCRETLRGAYRHLIADNLEEESPLTHDVLQEWLPDLESALLICDQDAGFRRFTAADPQSAARFKSVPDITERIQFRRSFVTPPQLADFSIRLRETLVIPAPDADLIPATATLRGAAQCLHLFRERFYPDMLEEAARRTATLIRDEGIAPDDIVILAPYVSDVLRFSLFDRLSRWQVPARAHRPSRPMRAELPVQSLITLMAIAHPAWGIQPDERAFAAALADTIEGMDVIRAHLLSGVVYRRQAGAALLYPFDPIRDEMKERITYLLGERYERLRLWLAENGNLPEQPDHFLSRLFGEVLSQKGFRYHTSIASGETCANLIESMRKFRWACAPLLAREDVPLGREYIQMLSEGVLAAQYVRSWGRKEEQGAVLVAPVHAFLMRNRPVACQIWLDVGSRGWSERLEQPLTHPYVLSRAWEKRRSSEPGAKWTNDDEDNASRAMLNSLVGGLLKRCTYAVHLGYCELGERGYENQSLLLRTLDQILRTSPQDFSLAESTSPS